MKRILYAFLIFTSQISAAADGWFCENDASKRNDNVYWSCGVGESTTESLARTQALKMAIQEFLMVCEMSTDCNGKPRTVEPKRTSCTEGKSGIVKCVRMIEIRVFPE